MQKQGRDALTLGEKKHHRESSSPTDRQPFDLNNATTGGVGMVHCSVHHSCFLHCIYLL